MGVVVVMPVQWDQKKERSVYELEGVHNVGDANGSQPTCGIMHLSLWTYPRRTCMSKKQNERAVIIQQGSLAWGSGKALACSVS